jgi:hypothetical protein
MFIIMYSICYRLYMLKPCVNYCWVTNIVTATVARYGQSDLASTIGCLYVAVHAVIIGTCHDIQLLE